MDLVTIMRKSPNGHKFIMSQNQIKPTAQAKWQNIPNLSLREVVTVEIGHPVLISYVFSGDEVQGVAWQQSGRLLATQSRDKRLRVIDPRVSAEESAGDCVAAEADSHGGIKDSKVVWVGQNSDRILTTGFSTVTS